MATAAAALKFGDRVVNLPLDLIDESPTNPRKTFDQKTIEELAASIKTRGLIHPVTARPVGTRYELVVGERRRRASVLAKLDEIQAFVRDLSDGDVVEMQLIENAQREDVPPLEEADGYKLLVETRGYTAEEIAAKVSKSPRTIHERLLLTKLCAEGRKALETERLTLGVAVLIARIPAEFQKTAVQNLAARGGEDHPAPYRAAVTFIHNNFMLQLKDAAWDLKDATLVTAAGACDTCPKRTGNQRVLFAEVKSPDVCTDPKCYHGKEEALWQLKVVKAEASGQKVLNAAATKKVFPFADEQIAGGSPFRSLDQEEYVGGKMRTVRSLLGKGAPPTTIARAPNGQVVELVPRELVEKKLREMQPNLPRSGATDEDKARNSKQRLRRDVVNEAIPQIVAAAEHESSVHLWRFLAERLIRQSFYDGVKTTMKRRGLEGKPSEAREVMFRQAMRLQEPELRGLVVEILAQDNATGGSYSGDFGQTFIDACKVFGVDLKKLQAAAKKEKAAKKAKKPTGKKGAGGR